MHVEFPFTMSFWYRWNWEADMVEPDQHIAVFGYRLFYWNWKIITESIINKGS